MNSEESRLITLEGEDGHQYHCEIFAIFELDTQTYALLTRVEDDQPVVMRLVQTEDQSCFQTIESDEEFERVVAHAARLALAS